MTHKELTAHIRNRIKAAGIKAKVRMIDGNAGAKVIQVNVPEYGMEFSHAEQREIRLIAQVNKLTLVRGMEIDLDRMTDPHSFDFYMRAA